MYESGGGISTKGKIAINLFIFLFLTCIFIAIGKDSLVGTIGLGGIGLYAIFLVGRPIFRSTRRTWQLLVNIFSKNR